MSRQRNQNRQGRSALVEMLEERRLLTALVPNTTVTAAISSTAEKDTYTFSASANQRVIFGISKAISSTYFDPQIVVSNSTNTNLLTIYSGYGSGLIGSTGEFVTPASGTYTVTVSERETDNTGQYKLNFLQLPYAGATTDPADGDGKTLVSNSTTNAELETGGDLDYYRFTGTASQRVVLGISKAVSDTYFDPQIDVYDPTGANVFTLYPGYGSGLIGASGDFVTAKSGTYTVVVHEREGDNTNAYKLNFLQLPFTGTATDPGDGDGNVLVSNSTTTAQLETGGDLDYYRFTANSGQRILLGISKAVSDTYFDPQIDVYDQSGNNVFSTYPGYGSGLIGANGDFVTASSGNFSVVVREREGDNANTYKLNFLQLPYAGATTDPADGDGKTLVSNSTTSAELETGGDLDYYRFTANSGQRIFLGISKAVSDTYFDPQLDIYNPAGTNVGSVYPGYGSGLIGASTEFVAATSGTFTVVVREREADQTNAYKLNFLLLPFTGTPKDVADGDGKTLVSNTTTNAEIETGADFDFYNFTAAANQRIFLGISKGVSDTYFDPQLDVYNAAGTNVLTLYPGYGSGLIGQSGEFVAPAAGTYSVVVRERESDGANKYKINFVTLPITAGPTDPDDAQGQYLSSAGKVTANITTGGDLDLHSFYAAPGDSISLVVHALSGNIDLKADLFKPDGTFFKTISTAGTGSVSTPIIVGGRYNLVFRELQGDEIGQYDVTLTLTPNYTQSKYSVGVSVFDPVTAEGAVDPAVIRFTRTNNRALPLDVNFTVTGSASSGDYNTLTGKITIQPNSAIYDLNLQAIADTLTEGTESITITLASGANYTIDTAAKTSSVSILPSGAASVAGKIFIDTNQNGTADSGEAGVASQILFIDANNNGKIDSTERTTKTDATGAYSFGKLPAGTYAVKLGALGTKVLLSPTTGVRGVTLTTSQASTGQNFALFESTGGTAKVSGSVFRDANANGVKNTGETALSNFRVFLDQDLDGVYDTGELSVLTDSAGAWAFSGLKAGKYVFRVVPVSGNTATNYTTGASVTLANAAVVTGKDFGFKTA